MVAQTILRAKENKKIEEKLWEERRKENARFKR